MTAATTRGMAAASTRLVELAGRVRANIPQVVSDLRRGGLDRMFAGIPPHLERVIGDRVEKMATSTTSGGKCLRGGLIAHTFDAIQRFERLPVANGDARTEAALRAAATIELLQAEFLVLDDVMDASETRRGAPCWHRQVGMSAVNDAVMLDVLAESTVRAVLPGHPRLHDILATMFKIKQRTVIGQYMDVELTGGGVHTLTWENYSCLVDAKTAFYTIVGPLRLGALIADRPDLVSPSVDQLAARVGLLFQAQDDVLDVFGDQTQTGKTGTDLREAKCTWVSVRARAIAERAGGDLEATFQELWGKPDRVDELRTFLDERLAMRQEWERYERALSEEIREDIASGETIPPHLTDVFSDLLTTLDRRRA